jgi:integral membrane sensor domain MASE1
VHLHPAAVNDTTPWVGPVVSLQRRYRLALPVVMIVIALGAYGSLATSISTPRLAPVWFPAGIALASLLLFGRRIVPALFAGLLAVSAMSGIPMWTSVVVAVSVVLEGSAGVYLLRNAADLHPGLRKVNDILAFLLFGVGIAPMIGATVGTLALCGSGVVLWRDAGYLWRFWWLGDAMGTLVIGSLALAWSHREEYWLSSARMGEGIIMFVLLISGATIVHAGVFEHDLAAPLSFVAFPFVIWAALRFGQKGATAATAVGVAFALWGVLHGEGPFAEPRFAVGLVFFYGYTASLGLTGLLLGASTTERRRSAEELRRIGQDLDIRVRERTADLQDELVRRRRAQEELQGALQNVKTLSGLLPICASCKKIRDDSGYWTQVERYLTEHTQAQFSHGMCPECFSQLYPEIASKYEQDTNGQRGPGASTSSNGV